jgi:hypothetical protein
MKPQFREIARKKQKLSTKCAERVQTEVGLNSLPPLSEQIGGKSKKRHGFHGFHGLRKQIG